jgi:hypothetical protein
MLTMPAARRFAAALTASLVAVVLVTLGGTAPTPGHGATAADASRAGTVVKPARVPQAVVPTQHHHVLVHLDLATTPPSTLPDVRETVTTPAPEAAVVRAGREGVTPNGRAPPAL